MKNQKIGIIGAGRFGLTLAESLAANDLDVTLLDKNWNIIQELSDSPIRAIKGDGTSPETLRESGFADCDVAVIAIASSLEASTLATINCKDLKIPRVIAKAASDLHGRVLERIGADLVIYPDRDRAYRLAKSLVSRAPLDLLEITDGYSVAEIALPKSLEGKTLIEGNVRQTHGVTVLAIRRAPADGKGPRETIITNGTERLKENDQLVVFGPDTNLDKLLK